MFPFEYKFKVNLFNYFILFYYTVQKSFPFKMFVILGIVESNWQHFDTK